MKQLFIYLFWIFISYGLSAQVGINTASPNPSAALDVTSTTNDKGFLPPRLTTAQRDAIATPAAGLIIYNTSVNCLQWYNGTYWYDGCGTSALISSYPTGSVFCTFGPTAIVDVTNPTTGKIWMDRNLGASQVATTKTDANSYGDLYQWGRRSDGHHCRTSANTTLNATVNTDTPPHGNFIITLTSPIDWRIPQNDNLWQGVSGINNPCPSGYRIPTETELNTERLSWSSNNQVGAFGSPLKFTVPGVRVFSNGSFFAAGGLGTYWSSTVSGIFARYLRFDDSAFMETGDRANGYSVRCIKDNSPGGEIGSINCNSATITGTLTSGVSSTGISALVDYTGGNGGSHAGQTVISTGVTGLTAYLYPGVFTSGAGDLLYGITGTPASSGTASFALNIGGQACTLNLTASPPSVPNTCIPSNPTVIVDVTNAFTGKIWMDRNLGSNRAATSSTDAESYGSLFQWGRGADGHQCVNRYVGDGVTTSLTTTILSTTDTPGHDNFITPAAFPLDWRSPQNDNLWQGVSGTNNPCPSGYQLPTETELNNERLSWVQPPISSTNTSAGAFASPLKLPTAGIRDFLDGSLGNVDIVGNYWSSTVSGTNARFLSFVSGSANFNAIGRAYGVSVRCIKNAPAIGSIGSLDCSGATLTGTLIVGVAASGVSSSVPYTGGNSGTHSGQIVTSTGVTGLTATLGSGSFGSGSGNLIYTITGTPASIGTASFALNIGGQACTLNITVSPPSVPNTCNTSNPTAIVDVTNSFTGKIWMDRNLGANRVAISSTDAESYGSLFQWGRGADGHQCVNRYAGDGVITSGTTSTLSSTDNPGNGNFILSTLTPFDWRSPQNGSLWQGVSGTNNPCPSGYRLPSQTELNNERLSWVQPPINSTNTSTGAFASPLKLPRAGIRFNSNGSLSDIGTFGYYWSSTLSGTSSMRLAFSNVDASMGQNNRAFGESVRCIKDESAIGSIGSLDCNGATLTGSLTAGVAASGVSSSVPYTGGNGGTHNGQIVTSTGVTGLTATLGSGSFATGAGNLTYMITGTPASSGTASFALNIGGQTCTLNITVITPSVPNSCNPSNPTVVVDVTNSFTGKIWMDRNLGANRAAISSTDAESYGSLFQWGRGADGHQCVNRFAGDGVITSGTTSTLSSSDSPGNANFILSTLTPFDWRSPQNDNLWQGVNGINNPCPSGYRLPSETELNNERLSWVQPPISSTNTSTGAFASPLKLPVAGFRSGGAGSLSNVGFWGRYWSSTINGTNTQALVFNSNASVSIHSRASGDSIRCIKN